jgi:hypothetical protein
VTIRTVEETETRGFNEVGCLQDRGWSEIFLLLALSGLIVEGYGRRSCSELIEPFLDLSGGLIPTGFSSFLTPLLLTTFFSLLILKHHPNLFGCGGPELIDIKKLSVSCVHRI